MHTLATLLPPDAMVVEEAPSHRNAMHDHLPIRRAAGSPPAPAAAWGGRCRPRSGTPSPIPGRRVVCLVGDGSSLYSIQALWTAAQHQLPLTVLVFDNGGYGASKALGLAMGVERPPGVDLPGLDLCAIARGFGCTASRVDAAADLPGALRRALARPGPVLLDITVDATVERLY